MGIRYRAKIGAWLVVMLWVARLPVHAQLQYAFSQAGNYPGAFYNIPLAGSLTQIVGYYDGDTGIHAYIQSGKKFTTAEPAGAGSSYLTGMNRNGLAAGGFCPKGCNTETGQHGYTYSYSNKSVVTIDYPGAGTSTSYGINNHGDVVGGFCANMISCPLTINSNTDHGYLDVNGVFTQLDYPGAESTQAMAINGSGTIVGAYMINKSGPHAFLYQNGTFTNIDYPGAGTTVASAINNLGVAAGLFQDAQGVHGFLYRAGRYEKVNDPNAPTNTNLTGINDKNDVVGIIGATTSSTFKGIPKK